jgi:hypothetical protein
MRCRGCRPVHLIAALRNNAVVSYEAPGWLDQADGWLVTFAEGRFGLCRILLRFGDELVTLAMPADEYTAVTRAVDASEMPEGSYNRALLQAMWEHGLLPSRRPEGDDVAPVLAR